MRLVGLYNLGYIGSHDHFDNDYLQALANALLLVAVLMLVALVTKQLTSKPRHT
ncbi:hypothetical protein ACNTOD_002837 [Vibrio navarrensis]